MAVVLAPVVEEMLFRGILYPVIKELGYPRFALWSTSLVFGLVHANFMTFLPLTFLALLLVMLYEATDNLLAPILVHSLFNAVNFFLLVFGREAIP
jgi:membrane protease YdiL (CAAX protease family)